jgi:hypothetical protein
MFNRYTLVEKWHMNRFLQKWLGYCLMQGHRFIPGRVLLPEALTSATTGDSVLIAES